MPNMDGTGPNGMGPQTGRGMGKCGSNNKGTGKGMGGGKGVGRGMGRGRFANRTNVNSESGTKESNK